MNWSEGSTPQQSLPFTREQKTGQRCIRIWSRCLWVLFFHLFFAFGAIPAEAREDCRVCGMWIDQYPRTRHVLTEADGVQVSFCSLTCAARYLKKKGVVIKLLRAADYLTGELVEVHDAVYLVGSDVPPVMSYISVIAFASRDAASGFQKVHGGTFMTFDQVLAEP